MNRKSRRVSKKQDEKRVRKMITSIHALIAVVAIIECLVLIVFSTYSWIESNSSLIIMNGPSSNVETVNKKLDIADELNYMINMNADSTDWSDLNSYFSRVKYFEFAKTTSSDGKTFFFPRRNNTYTNTTAFRKGDTIDYNTSYLYFDFVLNNKGSNAENYNIYFDDEFDTNIFTVTDGLFPSDNAGYLAALRKAMRMSITTKVGSSPEITTIYSYNDDSTSATGATYTTFDSRLSQPNASDLTTAEEGHHVSVSTHNITKSVYSTDNSGVVNAEKLFVAKKNAETKVSIRIWFEVMDPTFRTKFNIDDSMSFEGANYLKIPSATVGIKFRLKASTNDLRALNFDDYTFSNTANVDHLTEEDDDDSVWFYAYQPAVTASGSRPARAAAWKTIPLERDSSSAEFTRWTTSEVTASMMDYLRGVDPYNTTGYETRYTQCFFCYGDYSTKTAKYCWPLRSAPVTDNGEFTFNAYSYLPNSSTSTTITNPTDSSTVRKGTFKTGVGIWQDDDTYTNMKLLSFNDMATGVTDVDYNGEAESKPNYQFMKAAAVADSHTKYLVFANNINGFSSTSQTITLDRTESLSTTLSYSALGDITAAMYYDDVSGEFKSYVPSYWLTGDDAAEPANRGVSFTYSPTGVFSNSAATQRWYHAAPTTNDDRYVYTALGYTNATANNCYAVNYYNGTAGCFTGVGTWGDTEKIYFTTELIDNHISSTDRFFIGITGYSGASISTGYYAMVPNATNMTFSAYVPKDYGKVSTINFARYTYTSSTDASDHRPGVFWYSNLRQNYNIFYPVDVTNTASSSASPAYSQGVDYGQTGEKTHGYWNVSVIVDGTYENLIYTTLTDKDPSGSTYLPVVTSWPDNVDYSARKNYGTLEYSYDGVHWTGADGEMIVDEMNSVFKNNIDRYRFYAPAEGKTTVYWRWTPYKGYSIEESDPVDPLNPEVYASADDTVFTYTHDISNGIYLLVTEARNNVSSSDAEEEEPTEEPEVAPTGQNGNLQSSLNRISRSLRIAETEATEPASADATSAPYEDNESDASSYDTDMFVDAYNDEINE